MIKKSVLALVFLLFLSLVACNQDIENIKPNNKDEGKELKGNGNNTRNANDENNKNNINYSIWTTYWDTEDLEDEIEDVKDSIDNICYFAAYFNKDKTLFLPKETIESFERVKALDTSMEHNSYLTFVNDLILEDNTSSLKDVDLLYALFERDKFMNSHIQDILYMTINEGFDGIEIDYEAIKNDIELWELFIEFVDRLYRLADEKDILVRVVLEPNAPLDKIELPEGPEYVMMCYNLHGHGTSPGPKANKEFIEALIKKAETLPGRVNFALATGGYDFQSNGMARSLTEREAVELLTIYDKSPVRDKESQALFFNYIDDKGENHQVWYADSETIKYWISIIEKSGNHGISLWRMGGNLNLNDIVYLYG